MGSPKHFPRHPGVSPQLAQFRWGFWLAPMIGSADFERLICH
jgi:hypothetical protein